MLTDNPYSLIKLVSTPTHPLISISLANLVFILTFPYMLSAIYLYTPSRVGKDVQHCCFPHQFESFNMVSSSAKLICCTLLSFRNQLASSMVAPLLSSKTQVTNEFALTYNSELSMYHLYSLLGAFL